MRCSEDVDWLCIAGPFCASKWAWIAYLGSIKRVKIGVQMRLTNHEVQSTFLLDVHNRVYD